MAKIVSQIVLDYLDELQQALQLPDEAARAIVAEVRADLMQHVQRHVSKGCSEAEAVDLALAEMGPPAEMAAAMRSVVPPLGGPLIQWARCLVAVVVVLFCLIVFWDARAMSFGVSWLRMAAIPVVLLPLLLITWPQVIWRRNWMFTSVPTAVVILLIFCLFSMGTSQTTMPVVDAAPNTTEAYVPDDTAHSVARWVALGLMSVLTLYLLIMMQRRTQRLIALAVAVLAIALIEVPYLSEEYHYSHQLERAQALLADYQKQHGEFPAREQFDAVVGWDVSHYNVTDDRQDYSLFWDRTVAPGYALCYSSRGNRRWIND